MSKLLKRQNGFSLVELMVGLTITVILLSAMVPLFSTSITSWVRGNSRAEVQQTARVALDTMARDIKYASTTITKKSDNEISFTDSLNVQTGYRLDINSYVLYKILSNGTVQPLTDTHIYINHPSYTSEPLFTVQDANTVRISLTATDRVTLESTTLHTTVVRLAHYLKF